MNRFGIFGILLEYMRVRRMWFLSPILLVIGVLVVIAWLVQTSPLFLPFIYAGF